MVQSARTAAPAGVLAPVHGLEIILGVWCRLICCSGWALAHKKESVPEAHKKESVPKANKRSECCKTVLVNDSPLRDTCLAQEFCRLRHDYWLACLLLQLAGLQTASANPHHQ